MPHTTAKEIEEASIREMMKALSISELVITGDVLAEGGMKILRKRKAKSTQQDFQEMLGVTVPIPQDVLDALELAMANKALLATATMPGG